MPKLSTLDVATLAARFAAQDAAAPLAWFAEVPLSPEAWKQYRISANDPKGGHWAPGSKKVEFWRTLGAAVARAERAPKLSRGRVVVSFRFPARTYTKEVSNLQPTVKALVDGLVDARVFPEDNDGVVFGQDARRESFVGPLRMVVMVFGE